MKKTRTGRYAHLLRAMRAGDVLYLRATAKRFDRQVGGTIYRTGGRAEITNVVGVQVNTVSAEHLIKITMRVPMK